VQDSIIAVRAEASGSPTKSPSPAKLYLTKDSNTTGFAVWDVDGRVGDMESKFQTLSDMVQSTLDAKKAHDDALDLTRTRGKQLTAN
jgi:kinesin family protein C1